MEISVIIPCFNEAKVIAKTLKEVQKFLENNFSKFEIIIADDGSRDRTLDIVKQFTGIKILRNLTNRGKGYTVAKGVREAKGRMILFMDADNSTAITELVKLQPFIEEYSLVIGSRALPDSIIKQEQSKLKVWLGRSGNIFIKLLLTPGIQDTQCGFKLFDRSVKKLFEKLTINRWGFDFELLFLARKNGLKIKEVPIVWQNNADSRVTAWNYFQTLGQVFKVRINYLLKKYDHKNSNPT